MPTALTATQSTKARTAAAVGDAAGFPAAQRHRDGRKVNCRARDQMLSAEQQRELARICAAPGPQNRVNDYLVACGLAPLNKGAQSRMFHRYTDVADELQKDMQFVRQFKDKLRAAGTDLSEVLVDDAAMAMRELMTAARERDADTADKLRLAATDRLIGIRGTVLDKSKVELKREDQTLAREKFEFDAAKAALAKLPELRAIANDKSLDGDAKLLAVRQRLFGSTPA